MIPEMLERLVTGEHLPAVFLDPERTQWKCECYWSPKSCGLCKNKRRLTHPRGIPRDLLVTLVQLGASEILRVYELLRPEDGYVAWGYTDAPDTGTFLREREDFARSLIEREGREGSFIVSDRGCDASAVTPEERSMMEVAEDFFAFHGGPRPKKLDRAFVLVEVRDPERP